jgi:LAO/AO transport system kinase
VKTVSSWNDYTMQSSNGRNLRGLELLNAILQKPIKSDFEVARGISIIEESGIEIATLKSLIQNPVESEKKRIGITGAPGVGKSTFLNTLISTQDLTQYKVAVIAIDPSSRITKGALLGDRIRITENNVFENIYFRSMATRGAFGGLNNSIASILYFLANCGFSLIFVETVGVGQNEVEVAEYVDFVIHILDATAGDEVQMEKAGIMEIGDVYFVNKRDGQGNNQFITNLKSFVDNSNRQSSLKPEVIIGSAISGEGFEDLARHLGLSSLSKLGLDGGKAK